MEATPSPATRGMSSGEMTSGATQIVAVDAAGSALFGGTRGARALPGFGAGIETELSRSARFDALVRVSDLD